MNISFNWLQDYITIHESPREIADRLTMAGLEVESVRSTRELYKNFVIGEVRDVRNHPNADRLWVCDVFDGKNKHTVVCGASNVAAGQKIVFAQLGSIVPANGMEVRNVEIRGQSSAGMICSEYELEIGDDHDGILVLPGDTKPGAEFSRYYWDDDVSYEIGITPNRPDCLSHIGVAREIAALYKRQLKNPKITIKESVKPVKTSLTIDIRDADHCPRYVGRLIDGITIGESPDWMQRRLRILGMRPINAIVDVTNYVMMEYGQPLHAFDFRLIREKRIVVRRATEGETFITLDDKERSFTDKNLLICDANRPVAIAGVMGGLNSEINESTTSVLIESAYFAPFSVRNTSKQLGLVTESSYRFERGVDPGRTAEAADRAVQLIQEITGGNVYRGRVDAYPKKIRPLSVPFRTKQVERVLGIAIPAPATKGILKRLGVDVKDSKKSGEWRCIVPTFRPDIEREIDLIEEIVRIYGYDKIPAQEKAAISFNADDVRPGIHERIREWFVGAGFKEIICNSMVPHHWNSFSGKPAVAVTNPQNQDMAELRASLIPGMLQVVKHNMNRGNKNLRLYEIGHIFSLERFPGSKNYVNTYHEGETIGIVLTGSRSPEDWTFQEVQFDFFDLKGEVESLESKFNLDKIEYNIYHSTSNTLIDEAIGVEYQGVLKGYLGKISNKVLKLFDIESNVFAAELDLELFSEFARIEKKYREIPKYPPVHRDLAFLLDESVSYRNLENVIRNFGQPLLHSVSFFDVFRGERIGPMKKSIAVALELVSKEKTLTQPEIEETVSRIIQAVERQLGGELRS
jgi:phenylalanyl-tRNA synthetase beta chain